jgi:hypothetical protein
MIKLKYPQFIHLNISLPKFVVDVVVKVCMAHNLYVLYLQEYHAWQAIA